MTNPNSNTTNPIVGSSKGPDNYQIVLNPHHKHVFIQYLGKVCHLVAENLDEKEVAMFLISKRSGGISGESVYIQPKMKYVISLENIGNELLVMNRTKTTDLTRPKIGVSICPSDSF